MKNDDVRVLVADDSPTMRHYLVKLIDEMPGIRVVGEARNGLEVVDMTQSLQPDVISMDISMPVVDGLEATRRIMSRCPTPVVVVSGLLEHDVELAMEALEAGALAVIDKPPSRDNDYFNSKRAQLVTTLRAMAAVSVVARRDWQSASDSSRITPPIRPARRTRPEVIVIGASTGGPSALHHLLHALPDDLPVPIVVVQHMPHEFIAGLVRWLNSNTGLSVEIVADGGRLRPGIVLVSPGTAHVLVHRSGTELITRLISERGDHRYQPSIDILFESTARSCGSSAIGVVLTGMGDDGAAGLLALREAGARTFAQDEATSTVFGMPGAAIARGAAEFVTPLPTLASEILKLV